MACWTSTTSSSPSARACCVTGSVGDQCSSPPPLVRFFFLPQSQSTYQGCSWLGMLVFYTLQTVCFALYSIHDNITAAHVFIAMICGSLPFALSWDVIESTDLTCFVLVLFYGFCKSLCFPLGYELSPISWRFTNKQMMWVPPPLTQFTFQTCQLTYFLLT